MTQDLSTPTGEEVPSTAVEQRTAGQVISDDTLTQVRTFEDAFNAVQASGASVEDWSDYGTGFTVLEDKNQLIKSKLIILEWRFNQGDNGEFVSAAIMTADNRKFIINDGGTGIRDQLAKVTDKRRERGAPSNTWQTGLLVENGLRASTYQRKDDQGELMTDAKGQPLMATTYYLG